MNPIQELLKKTGLNQSELQRELGLKTVTTVWRWVNEWDKYIPSYKNQTLLITIAKKYGINLTYDDLSKR
jgi:tRNA splicing ligase